MYIFKAAAWHYAVKVTCSPQHMAGQHTQGLQCAAGRTIQYHYRGKGSDQADLKRRIKEIAETRARYGYRRIHVLLRREGWAINGKRVYRL
jgi:hypothetical protein